MADKKFHSEIVVKGLEYDDRAQKIRPQTFHCLMTADRHGKTISIDNDKIQFTLALEPILRELNKIEEEE